MKAQILSAVQSVAGVGRTTVATNLAGELARFNTVALIDCDPLRGRSAEWGAVRQQESYSDRLAVYAASTPTALIERVSRVGEKVNYIVIDGPRDNVQMTWAILAISRLCLLPIDTSSPDPDQTVRFLGVVQRARRRYRLRARILRTRHRHKVKPEPTSRQPDRSSGLKVLQSGLSLRLAYPDALGTGRTAGETRDPIARDEVQALAMEIKLLLRPLDPAGAPKADGWQDSIVGNTMGPRSLMHLIG